MRRHISYTATLHQYCACDDSVPNQVIESHVTSTGLTAYLRCRGSGSVQIWLLDLVAAGLVEPGTGSGAAARPAAVGVAS